MANVVSTELADVLGELPEIGPFDLHSPGAVATDDLFLCALGFEPRCLTLPCQLQEASYRARRAVYFKYSTNIDDNSVNLPALEEHLRRLSETTQFLEADSEDFPNQLRSLLALTVSEASGESPRVTFDISVTANRLLLRCMKVLLEYSIHLRVIYSEAAVYHPTRDEYLREQQKLADDEAFGLERGVREIIPSTDHPGHALDPMPDFMILFPSFKRGRSKAVISSVDPSLLASPGRKVVWLLGLPHLDENSWRVDAMKAINGISGDAPQYIVSTFRYKDALDRLERLHMERSDTHSITLSPLGSKMQALATAFFCYMHPDVRVVLSTPEEYNASQYSEGCRGVWYIDFASLEALRRKLDAVGTLRIED